MSDEKSRLDVLEMFVIHILHQEGEVVQSWNEEIREEAIRQTQHRRPPTSKQNRALQDFMLKWELFEEERGKRFLDPDSDD